jgi:hypothetical protein
MRIKFLMVPCMVLSSVALACAAGVGAGSAAAADPLAGGSTASAAHVSPSATHNYLLNINPGGFTYNMSVTGKMATTVNTVSGDVEHYTVKVRANKHVKFTEIGGGNCVLKGKKTASGYNTAGAPGTAICDIGTFSWFATKA